MPVVVTAAGPTANTMSLDLPERQVLVGMQDENEGYWLHLLMVRLDQARWVTVDPMLDIAVDDLSGEELIPIARRSPFPAAGRPLLVHSPLDEATLTGLRVRAQAMAEIHGMPGAGAPLAGAAGWYHADTAQASFGEEVPVAQVADPGVTRFAGSVGLLKLEAHAGETEKWVHIERVMRTDVEAWRAEKREGHGRDPRLSSLSVVGPLVPMPLFRQALAGCPQPAKPTHDKVFEGPAALHDLLLSIQKSGLEPPAYVAQFMRNSGLNSKSSVGIEYTYLVHLLYMFMVQDRLNPYACASMEHLARRCLQIQRAVQRNPRSPEFDGLEEYMRHAADSSGAAFTPGFDRHIAERQKTESQILKQHRLQREELEHENKHRKNWDGGGRGSPKGEPKGEGKQYDKAQKGAGKGVDPG